jgi:very-short-patch-repair endonuclease
MEDSQYNKNEYSHNLKEQKTIRRTLRTHGTPAEAMLWKMLKGKQMDGAKFRRQFSIGPYILDFYCPECRICIELDGDGHYSADGYEHDQKRNSYLYEEHGITTLRYENMDVFKSPENICKQICEVIRAKRDKTYTAIPFQQTVPLRQGDEERSDGGGG